MSKRAAKLGVKLVFAAIMSVAIAVGAFALIRWRGETAIERMLESPDFRDRETQRIIGSMQTYVDQHSLTIGQADRLSALYSRYDVYMLLLFKGGVVLYDSSGIWTGERTSNVLDASETTHTLRFADHTKQKY